MVEDSGFEFDPNVMAAEERDALAAMSADGSDLTDTENTVASSTPPKETGHGVVAALKATFETEVQGETSAHDTSLLILGIALSYYEVRSLSALLDCANADPHPPQSVEAVLPFARQLVE